MSKETDKKYLERKYGGKFVLGKDVRANFPKYAKFHKMKDDEEYLLI